MGLIHPRTRRSTERPSDRGSSRPRGRTILCRFRTRDRGDSYLRLINYCPYSALPLSLAIEGAPLASRTYVGPLSLLSPLRPKKPLGIRAHLNINLPLHCPLLLLTYLRDFYFYYFPVRPIASLLLPLPLSLALPLVKHFVLLSSLVHDYPTLSGPSFRIVARDRRVNSWLTIDACYNALVYFMIREQSVIVIFFLFCCFGRCFSKRHGRDKGNAKARGEKFVSPSRFRVMVCSGEFINHPGLPRYNVASMVRDQPVARFRATSSKSACILYHTRNKR